MAPVEIASSSSITSVETGVFRMISSFTIRSTSATSSEAMAV